jgi:hypothetical protein
MTKQVREKNYDFDLLDLFDFAVKYFGPVAEKKMNNILIAKLRVNEYCPGGIKKVAEKRTKNAASAAFFVSSFT